ncbi:MAG: nitroreductase family deazaflavin-dependent oxidoreductase [Solirubrobacterales bacterium]
MSFSQDLEQHQYCYLTTTGRVTGRPHRIEIWFAIIDGRLFLNSGGGDRSDWVKNLMANPAVTVEIGDQQWEAKARVRPEEVEHPAREHLAARYQGWSPGKQLSDWASGSLLVEITAKKMGAEHG